MYLLFALTHFIKKGTQNFRFLNIGPFFLIYTEILCNKYA